MGAVRNAQLAPVIFPEWRVRFYCKNPIKQERYDSVPARLSTLQYSIAPTHRNMPTTEIGIFHNFASFI